MTKENKSSPQATLTVAVIEDDASVRKILVRWLNTAPHYRCVGHHHCFENAVGHLPKERPDVVLVDINLSGQSGIQCVKQLKPVMPATQFLMLTVYEDADHIFDALKAGASGYMLKRTPREELLASIRQVHEGGAPMTGYIARKVVQSFIEVKPEKVETENLSQREMEVLRFLARGSSYKDIAAALGIGIGTVNTHIYRIYQKLHVQSRTEAVIRFGGFPPP